MALIRCPECGREISQYAEKCPNCGWPVRYEDQNAYDRGQQNDSRQQNDYRTQSGQSQRQGSPSRTQDVKKNKNHGKRRGSGLSAPGMPHTSGRKRVVHKTKNKGNTAGTVFISVIITLLILVMLAVGAYLYFFVYGEKDNDYDRDTQIEQTQQIEENVQERPITLQQTDHPMEQLPLPMRTIPHYNSKHPYQTGRISCRFITS